MTRLFAGDGRRRPPGGGSASPPTPPPHPHPPRRVAGPLPEMPKDAPRPRVMREFRVESADGYEAGQTLDVTLFAAGDLVDVTGLGKGRGFAGTIKRHHFHRGPVTHGSTNTRQPGSIGAGTTPGRVFKGTKMGGHMGDDQVTVKRLIVERVDNERNLLLVKGAVPGARNGLLLVQKAK